MNYLSYIHGAYLSNEAHLRALLEGIPADQLTRQSSGIKNHPIWLIGHLIVSSRQSDLIINKDDFCPKEWEALFAQGTEAINDSKKYPTIEVLLTTLEASRKKFWAAFSSATDNELQSKPSDPSLAEFFDNNGVCEVQHMLGHDGYHIGQIASWRGAMGYAPIF